MGLITIGLASAPSFLSDLFARVHCISEEYLPRGPYSEIRGRLEILQEARQQGLTSHFEEARAAVQSKQPSILYFERLDTITERPLEIQALIEVGLYGSSQAHHGLVYDLQRFFAHFTPSNLKLLYDPLENDVFLMPESSTNYFCFQKK